MPLDRFFAEIESLRFQIQFSVLSGIQSVQRALARDETVSDLLAELERQPELGKVVCERIRTLLTIANQVTDLSYDESIVAYLFVLKRRDPALAHKASQLIWETGGLLWSCWLAGDILKIAQQRSADADNSEGLRTSLSEDLGDTAPAHVDPEIAVIAGIAP